MKHIKTYESTNNNIVANYRQQKKNFKQIEKKLMELADEYILLNSRYYQKKFSISTLFISYGKWYEHAYKVNLSKNSVRIVYSYKENSGAEDYDAITLTGKDFEDFLRFVENPELYKSIKNYNL
jgi:hypothetical protein